VRGRRGEQRGQAGQAQVRRPPEHGHQPSPHGPAEARPRGDGGLHARRLVPHFPSSFLSIPAPRQGQGARCVGVGRPVAVAQRLFCLSGSRRLVLFVWLV
jgi:hypothetical protein